MSSSFPTTSMVRIGDRERDQATECLREHMASGRLDQAEFEQRIEAALNARYADDLRPLFIDLPAPRPDLPTVRREPATAPVAADPVPQSEAAVPSRSSYTGWRVATAVVWTVAIIACIASGWHLWWLLFVPLVMGGGCGGHRSQEAQRRRIAERQLRWEARGRRLDARVRTLHHRHW